MKINRAHGLLIPVLCLSCLMSPTPAMSQDTGMSLQRTTLSVSDLEKSLAFYRDILGFSVRSASDYETPALRKIFHLKEGSGSQLVLLDASDTQPRSLAMVHAPGMKAAYESNLQHAPALVFNTNSLDMIQARMAGSGFEILLPPTPLMDFSGKPMGREAAYVDPDGVRVVLFERVSVSKTDD